jgi:hypothetical protein
MPITEALLAELKAKHPDKELHLLESPQEEVEIVVHKPSEPEWRRFRTIVTDEDQRAGALRQLLVMHVVYPKDEILAILAKHPGLAETFGNKVVKIAGVDPAATSRKL